MADLSCKYLNLQLQNPFIVNCSAFKDNIEKIIQVSEAGAGAITLQPIFEEEIEFEEGRMTDIELSVFHEAADYVKFYSKEQPKEKYLQLIDNVKKELKIPVIASINCMSAGEWMNFTKKIEEAGADAIELNVFFFPNDKDFRSEDYERIYYDIVTKVAYISGVPVILKIGPYFTNLLYFADQIFHRGIKGIEIFSHSYQPDIDIELIEYTQESNLTNPVNVYNTMRWISIISSQVQNIQIATSVDTFDVSNSIKLLLAGAHSLNIYSSFEEITGNLKALIDGVEAWMLQKGFENIEQFQGQLNYSIVQNPYLFERSQYMRYFN